MIKSWVKITDKSVTLNGQMMDFPSYGNALLTEIYRSKVKDYPKFFKMDALCKLGFLGSELVIQDENTNRFVPREDRAVILFNRSGSLNADVNFQATLQPDDFFPSPALFVYTLPNIITGEIAIRNKYLGETSFYVLEKKDSETIASQIVASFQDNITKSVIGGWVDCVDENNFEAVMFLCYRDEENKLHEEIKNILSK